LAFDYVVVLFIFIAIDIVVTGLQVIVL